MYSNLSDHFGYVRLYTLFLEGMAIQRSHIRYYLWVHNVLGLSRVGPSSVKHTFLHISDLN